MKRIKQLINVCVVKTATPILAKLGVHKGTDGINEDDWRLYMKKQIVLSHYVGACLFLVFSIIILLFSATIDLFGNYCDESFFQRAGAILVASALTLEFLRNNARQDDPHEDLIVLAENIYTLRAFDSIFRQSGWLVAVLGTVIWAYGDLLLSGGPCCRFQF